MGSDSAYSGYSENVDQINFPAITIDAENLPIQSGFLVGSS